MNITVLSENEQFQKIFNKRAMTDTEFKQAVEIARLAGCEDHYDVTAEVKNNRKWASTPELRIRYINLAREAWNSVEESTSPGGDSLCNHTSSYSSTNFRSKSRCNSLTSNPSSQETPENLNCSTNSGPELTGKSEPNVNLNKKEYAGKEYKGELNRTVFPNDSLTDTQSATGGQRWVEIENTPDSEIFTSAPTQEKAKVFADNPDPTLAPPFNFPANKPENPGPSVTPEISVAAGPDREAPSSPGCAAPLLPVYQAGVAAVFDRLAKQARPPAGRTKGYVLANDIKALYFDANPNDFSEAIRQFCARVGWNYSEVILDFDNRWGKIIGLTDAQKGLTAAYHRARAEPIPNNLNKGDYVDLIYSVCHILAHKDLSKPFFIAQERFKTISGIPREYISKSLSILKDNGVIRLTKQGCEITGDANEFEWASR